MTDGGFDQRSVFEGGVAIVVGTVGPDGRPAITRGWGPMYDPATNSLVLSITAPAGSPTLANLEESGAIAVTASQPLTYQTVQVKGTVDDVRAPSESDLVEALEHLDRFVDEVARLGIEEADKLYLGDLRTVTVSITQIYDQTPGRGAASRPR